MQAADLRDRDHLSDLARDYGSWVRAILIERKMGTRSMVILKVGRQDPAQMAFVDDHNVIQMLSADRAYDPLDIGVLPRRSRCGDDIPIASTRLPNSEPYDASRSRSR